MPHKTLPITLFALLAFLFAACGLQIGQPAAEKESVPATGAETETIAEDASAAAAPVSEAVIIAESVEEEAVAESAAEPDVFAPLVQATAAAPQDTFFEDYGVNPYVLAGVDHLSTFALDVDTASYSIARRYINEGLQPPPEAIRVEEFVNSFGQGYAYPSDAAFAIIADGAPSPWHGDGTYFLRIGVQGYRVAEEERAPAALTFVIDVSGSMAEENRLELVKQSLQLLVERMRGDDTIAIIVYGTNARVVLPPTSGADRATILSAIYALQPEGSTNLEAGLRLGYEIANEAYKEGGINRVILASDGVANVGATGPDAIVEQIRSYADAGITLTTIGFGLGNFNDVMMEQLANDGDGVYAYVDSLDEAETLFVDNLTSTLQVIARDAKIQVEFNPEMVQQYRLIGYENRAVADEDFRNDSVDAGEIGAGHTAVAVYAVQFLPEAQGHIATINLRWQDPDTHAVQEINHTFSTADLSPSFEEAPLRYQLAVVVSQFAEVLRASVWAEGVRRDDLRVRSERLAAQLEDPAVAELASLIARNN